VQCAFRYISKAEFTSTFAIETELASLFSLSSTLSRRAVEGHGSRSKFLVLCEWRVDFGLLGDRFLAKVTASV